MVLILKKLFYAISTLKR